MKNFKLALLLLLISFIAFNSCEKDSKPKNHFKYDGKTYLLDKGFIEEWGSNGNGSYDFDVYLASSSINYSAVDEEFSGVGHAVYLDLNTSSEYGLVNGTYTYSSERNVFTFVDSGVAIDADFDNETGTFLDMVGGTIDITITNGEVLIEFDLTTTANKTITGRFKGFLTDIS